MERDQWHDMGQSTQFSWQDNRRTEPLFSAVNTCVIDMDV